jgi:hypothetical protein
MKIPRGKPLGIFVGEEIYCTGGVLTPPSNNGNGKTLNVYPISADKEEGAIYHIDG